MSLGGSVKDDNIAITFRTSQEQKATSSLFPSEIIAKLGRIQSTAKQHRDVAQVSH